MVFTRLRVFRRIPSLASIVAKHPEFVLTAHGDARAREPEVDTGRLGERPGGRPGVVVGLAVNPCCLGADRDFESVAGRQFDDDDIARRRLK